MDIKHTHITEERREVRVSAGSKTVEIVEENVEVISVAAAELRKVEEVAAAQALAIAGRRGEEPEPDEAEAPVSDTAEESESDAAEESASGESEEPLSEAAGEPDDEGVGEAASEAVTEAESSEAVEKAESSNDAEEDAAEGSENASVAQPVVYDSDATVRVIGVRFRNAVKVF